MTADGCYLTQGTAMALIIQQTHIQRSYLYDALHVQHLNALQTDRFALF